MDWSRIDSESTRSITRDTLGAVALKHSKSLSIGVCLVFLDVKPALLVDTFCADPAKMALYIKRLEEYLSETQLDIPIQSVRVLEIEGDVVIINETQWSRMMDATAFEDAFFVDASSTLKDPRPLDDATRRLLVAWMSGAIIASRLVEENYNAELISFFKLSLRDHVGTCVPSLFGVLLGYPVVYYAPDGDNCLSLVPLTLVTLKGCIDDYPCHHVCLSFSVPSQSFTHDILAALHSMKTRAASHLKRVQLCVENVTQTSISL